MQQSEVRRNGYRRPVTELTQKFFAVLPAKTELRFPLTTEKETATILSGWIIV